MEDLRGTFKGMSDELIYQWAYDRYWARCSREFIIWLGGEHGTVMKPAVADWGIHEKVFYNDLSTRVTDTAEYALSRRLLSEMKPMSMVMGWHSYAKDLEEEHVALTSSFGHRVEGLNTLPNLSFSAQIPVSPGFKFTNNHHVKPGEKLTPEKKVYVTCIQTDGMGLGAWLKPGRGEIPCHARGDGPSRQGQQAVAFACRGSSPCGSDSATRCPGTTTSRPVAGSPWGSPTWHLATALWLTLPFGAGARPGG